MDEQDDCSCFLQKAIRLTAGSRSLGLLLPCLLFGCIHNLLV